MSINKKESLREDILKLMELRFCWPQCDFIKIMDIKINDISPNNIFHIAHVNLSFQKEIDNEYQEVWNTLFVFECPNDLKEHYSDLRKFMYPAIELMAMQGIAEKGTVDRVLKTDQEEFIEMVKGHTEDFDEILEAQLEEELDL